MRSWIQQKMDVRLHIHFWLGYPDSNQERQDQNLQCYHYTIPQFLCIEVSFSRLRVQRYDFFLNLQNFLQLFFKKTVKI